MLTQSVGTVPRLGRWLEGPLARVPSQEGAGRLAQRARAAVLGPNKETAPLGDLSPLCQLAGVTVTECSLGAARGGTEALLWPLPNDCFAIDIDPRPMGGWGPVPQLVRNDLRRHRRRFRVAHELAHTLFYWRGGGRPVAHCCSSLDEERFADQFARELLVPSAALRDLSPTPGIVVAAQDQFDVSLEVALRAFMRAHPQIEAGLWWRPRTNGALRAQWTSHERVGGAEDRCEAVARATPDVDVDVDDWRVRWLADRRQLLAISATPTRPR